MNELQADRAGLDSHGLLEQLLNSVEDGDGIVEIAHRHTLLPLRQCFLQQLDRLVIGLQPSCLLERRGLQCERQVGQGVVDPHGIRRRLDVPRVDHLSHFDEQSLSRLSGQLIEQSHRARVGVTSFDLLT